MALRRGIERGQFHPEQARDSFLDVARDRAPCESIARAAISEGTRKGLAAKAAKAAEIAAEAAALANE